MRYVVIFTILLTIFLISGCVSSDTDIKINGCGEPLNNTVSLPVTLPIDSQDEVRVLVNECSKNALPEEPKIGNEPKKISETEKEWIIYEKINPILGYSTWNITINKTSGELNCNIII